MTTDGNPEFVHGTGYNPDQSKKLLLLALEYILI